MLVEVAEVAMAQAATQSLRTLADDSTMVVDNESAADGPPMGHVAKKMPVGVGEDGIPEQD